MHLLRKASGVWVVCARSKQHRWGVCMRCSRLRGMRTMQRSSPLTEKQHSDGTQVSLHDVPWCKCCRNSNTGKDMKSNMYRKKTRKGRSRLEICCLKKCSQVAIEDAMTVNLDVIKQCCSRFAWMIWWTLLKKQPVNMDIVVMLRMICFEKSCIYQRRRWSTFILYKHVELFWHYVARQGKQCFKSSGHVANLHFVEEEDWEYCISFCSVTFNETFGRYQEALPPSISFLKFFDNQTPLNNNPNTTCELPLECFAVTSRWMNIVKDFRLISPIWKYSTILCSPQDTR